MAEPTGPETGESPLTGFEGGLDRLVRRLIRGCELLTMAIGIWLMVILVINVFTRYVLNYTLFWVDESSELLLVWLMLAVAPIGFHENFHISMSFLADVAPRPFRLGLALFTNLGTVLFFVIAGYYGILSTITEFGSSLFSIPIMRGWVTWILPVSSVVILLVCLNNILAVLRLGDQPPAKGGLVS